MKKGAFAKIVSKMPSDVYLDMGHDRGFREKPEAMIKKFKKKYGLEPTPQLYHPVVIKWSQKDVGFGEITFYRKGDKTFCDSECMSRSFVKWILIQLVDSATFTDEPKKKGKRK